jgi:hypothetical protein
MNFRASFCDPLKRDIIELGDVEQHKIVEMFRGTPWSDYLRKMEDAETIYYSPSLEIENKDTRHGLVFSAIGQPDSYEFYIFYKRPKKVKAFLGLSHKTDENYLTDITGQTEQDVLDCLDAFIKGDTGFLAKKVGE